VTGDDERDRPPGQHAVESGADRGAAEHETVDTAVEPGAEPRRLPERAGDRAVEHVRDSGGEQDDEQARRRQHKERGHRRHTRERQEIRDSQCACVLQHPEVPVEHQHDERPPRRPGDRQPRTAEQGDRDPGGDTERSERERLLVRTLVVVAGESRPRERTRDESLPRARAVARRPQLGDDLARPELALGHRASA